MYPVFTALICAILMAAAVLPEVDILTASDTGQRSVEHLAGLAAMCVKDPAELHVPAAG